MKTINLDLLANLCSILSTIITAVLFIYNAFKKRENKNGFNRSVWLLLFVIIVVLFFGSLLLFVLSISSKNTNYWWGVTLLMSIFSFWLYAHKAFESLDNNSIENILPPKLLWQMLFNKIPARVINVDRIITFAVVKMDDCEEVDNAASKIEQSYGIRTEKEIQLKERIQIKPMVGFKRSKKGKYSFDLQDLVKSRDLSGVIFLIGTSADDDANIKPLRNAIDDFSNVRREIPIGYVQCGNKLNFKLHFEEIGKERLGDCVHHLIMRGYNRSKMQFDLGNGYQKFCWGLFILFLVSLIGLFCVVGVNRTKEGILHDNTETIEELKKALNLFDGYKRTKPLPNDIYNKSDTAWDRIEFESIRNDFSLQEMLKDVSSYYFGDINSYKGIKIWLKKSDDNMLHCVFNSVANDNGRMDIPNSYCVGKVAEHRLFFLWPGVKNKDNTFFNGNPKVVWYYLGNDDKERDDYIQKDTLDVNNKYWCGKIYEGDGKDRQWITDTLKWVSSSNPSDDELAAFCFSYDKGLIIEIDCDSDMIDDDYKYMSRLMFRNSVRKYVKFIYCLLQQDKFKLSLQDKTL